jgi:hypothetical protein
MEKDSPQSHKGHKDSHKEGRDPPQRARRARREKREGARASEEIGTEEKIMQERYGNIS